MPAVLRQAQDKYARFGLAPLEIIPGYSVVVARVLREDLAPVRIRVARQFGVGVKFPAPRQFINSFSSIHRNVVIFCENYIKI